MKAFKQYISEIGMNTALDLITRTKLKPQDKKDIAKQTADEVEDKMVKKYQLPTKVV